MTNQSTCMNMIKQQLRTGDVLGDRILDLFKQIPRDAFVPSQLKNFAYSDMQIELAQKQRMLTPLEEGSILQALNLQGHEVVLEIGTGTGFFTALLSRLCKRVISVDYHAEFTSAARRNLAEQQCNNVELFTGDASRGWLEQAPYDVIVFTGALESLEETHRLQLLPGGRIFAIIGKEPMMEGLLFELDHNGGWQRRFIFDTNIPPLIDKLRPRKFVF